MATDISYQKARRIRGTSFADLLSDQLMDAPTIRGAIGKTISLKTQARIKGFKEKFDPLNIAKFLTFGSSLGPALLGRLTGRSEKDIQYFSGRMRPIRDRGTASRIGKDPSMGDSKGVNDMLKKIYYLMQITRESDLQRRDVEMNFEEERKIEAEKRHKELLKVLSNLAGQTAVIVGDGYNSKGFLSKLMDLFGGFDFNARKSGRLGKIGKAAGSLGGSLARLVFGIVTSPAFILAAAPTLLTLMAAKEKEEIEANPNDPKYKDNPYAIALRENITAGQAAKRNTAQAVTQRETARRGEIQMALDEKTPESVLIERYGATENVLRTWLSNPANMVWTGPESVKNQMLITPPPPATVIPPPPPRAATPVVGNNLTGRLNEATNFNLQSNLPTGATQSTSVVNNVNAPQVKNMPQKLLSLNAIAVRNTEPTFLRMIMDSTRVV